MFGKKKTVDQEMSFEDRRAKTEVYDVGLGDASKAVLSAVVAVIKQHEQYDGALTEMYYEDLNNKRAIIKHIEDMHTVPDDIEDVEGWMLWSNE